MTRSFITIFALVGASVALAATTAPAASTATSADPMLVHIFTPRGGTGANCTRVYPLGRTLSGPAVLTGAMRALVAGPTASERARGYGGWFSGKTKGALRSVRISRGTAYVDFRDFSRLIPNASSSCGSALLLAQLDRTALQFPTVKRAVYSFNGNRSAFYEWLQRSEPNVR